MKGTIDVQIKHKDGSIETRHEHNVVFDIPALTCQKVYESPLATATGVPTYDVTLMSSRFSRFGLSEDTISTAEPQYVPPTLLTTTGSSSTWYMAPSTSVSTNKSVTLSATWTVNSAMTLKSIFYRMASEYELLDYDRVPRFTSKDNIYIQKIRRLKKSVLNLSNFAMSGDTSWNSLVARSNSSTAFEDAYIDYPLCNPDERFVCSYISGSSTYYTDWLAVSSNAVLEIRNKDTNTVIRSFPMTQFTGFRTTYSSPSGSGSNDYSYKCACVVNIGTKNVLVQPTYLGASLNIWQIPDTVTEDPIPVAATVLENQCNYRAGASNQINIQHMSVIGPYIYWIPSSQTELNTSRKVNIARINDDLSVTTFSGYSGAATVSVDSSDFLYSSGKMTFVRKYLDYSTWRSGDGNNGIYEPIYTNNTAANFSTPIVLAQGDVLTVSYKIEVA